MTKINIHGTGLIYGGVGVIIRGASGSGKSLLTLSLLEFSDLCDGDACLVGDDQIFVSSQNQQLIMTAPPSIKGKIELFGRGILQRRSVSSAPIDLIIDIEDKIERLPEPSQLTIKLLNREVLRCPVANTHIIGLTHQRMIVLDAINIVRSQKRRQAQ